MKVFVAGATGAIGRPLIAELVRRGHAVTGMTRSEASARGLEGTWRGRRAGGRTGRGGRGGGCPEFRCGSRHRPADLLTQKPGRHGGRAATDRRLRIEGGGNLRRAALACGARRYVQQSSGFFLAPGEGLADESVGMAVNATPGVASHARSYAELEARVLAPGPLEGVAMRYGFFYGPGTWYSPEGACADQARRQEIPIVGEGAGVWSWVHIVDAAHATVAALTAPPGVYNVVDDDPSPVNVWLPAFARSVGAPPPPQVTEEQARAAAGEDAVYYGTKLRGASNAKARKALGFKPRRLEWLAG